MGIQLRQGPYRGRLVIPCDHSYWSSNPDELVSGHGDPAPGTGSHVIYSDDHGQSWKLGGTIRPLADECQVVELTDGRLQMNMRSYFGKNRRTLSWSGDGGETWSEIEHSSDQIEPVCQASLLRYSWPDQGGGLKSYSLFHPCRNQEDSYDTPTELRRRKLVAPVQTSV